MKPTLTFSILLTLILIATFCPHWVIKTIGATVVVVAFVIGYGCCIISGRCGDYSSDTPQAPLATPDSAPGNVETATGNNLPERDFADRLEASGRDVSKCTSSAPAIKFRPAITIERELHEANLQIWRGLR